MAGRIALLVLKGPLEAAHHINDYPGKCARLPGHNWGVEAVVKGRELDELGMLVDIQA